MTNATLYIDGAPMVVGEAYYVSGMGDVGLYAVESVDIGPAIRVWPSSFYADHRHRLPAFVRLSRTRERAKERRAIMRAHRAADGARIRDRSDFHYYETSVARGIASDTHGTIWRSFKRRLGWLWMLPGLQEEADHWAQQATISKTETVHP